jgi:hypothetical protein
MCSLAGAYVTSSFRSQATAGLWTDDYDLLFEPARIPLVAGSRVYTGLSNLVSGQEEQFGTRADNFYFVGGSTNALGAFHPGLVFDRFEARTPRFTGISSEYGDSLFGEARLVETELSDLDSNGTYDHKRVTVTDVRAWDASQQTDAYLGLGIKAGALRFGAGYARYCWQTENHDPGFNRVWERRDSSLVDGRPVFSEKDSSIGSSGMGTTDNRIIANAWYDMEFIRVGLLADFTPLSTRYTYDARQQRMVDRSPANPLIADYVHVRAADTSALPLSGNRMSATLSLFYVPSEKLESRFYLSGATLSRSVAEDAAGLQTFLADSVARPGLDTVCDSSYARYSGRQTGTNLSLSTRQLITVTEDFKLGLGLGFSTATSRDSLTSSWVERSYAAHNNGDTIAGREDWRRRVSSTEDWLNRATSSTSTLSLPVGIEYRIVRPVALRLGFSHTITWRDETRIEQLVGSSPELTRIDYGDGSYFEYLGTAQTRPGQSETQQRTTHATSYTYGIGFHPIDNLQIDLAGFARLTDLTNWRLSATLRF